LTRPPVPESGAQRLSLQERKAPRALIGVRSSVAPHVVPLTICLLAAFAISFLPILIWRQMFHRWIYLADKDNLLYLQLAAQSYYRHVWYLADPVDPRYESYFPWLIYFPSGAAARIFGLDVFDITILWHVWSAVGLALGLYFFFYYFTAARWIAAAASVFAMSDAGMIVGQPLFHHLWLLAEVSSGSAANLLHEWPPVFLTQWRIVDPALGLSFLLLHFIAIRMARRSGTTPRIAFAGVTLGLLFYVYFYFWTAALCGLVLASLVDREKRGIYLNCLWIGLMLGAPILLHQMHLRASSVPDALPRKSYFLPVPHLSYLMIPKVAIFWLVVAAIWIWIKSRLDALYLWCVAIAALALANSHVIIGIDLESGHWRMIWGPMTELLIIIAAMDLLKSKLNRAAAFRWIGGGVTALFLVSALYLQRIETLKTDEAQRTIKAYRQFEAAEVNVRALVPGSVIAGTGPLCEFAIIASDTRPLFTYVAGESLWMNDHEWTTRNALNGYLAGLDRTAFHDYAHDFAERYGWGPWSVNDSQKVMLQNQLDDLYDSVARDPASYLQRFGVRYVLLPADLDPPAYLAKGWTRVASGPGAQIWERSSVPESGPNSSGNG
jgi:hypothetical protein